MSLSTFGNDLDNLSVAQLADLFENQSKAIDCNDDAYAASELSTGSIGSSHTEPEHVGLNEQKLRAGDSVIIHQAALG